MADSTFPCKSGNSVILGTRGWIEEACVVEALANDIEDFVKIESLVTLVDGNKAATPVDCIDRVTVRELLGPRGERISTRDEVRV